MRDRDPTAAAPLLPPAAFGPSAESDRSATGGGTVTVDDAADRCRVEGRPPGTGLSERVTTERELVLDHAAEPTRRRSDGELVVREGRTVGPDSALAGTRTSTAAGDEIDAAVRPGGCIPSVAGGAC